jgi:hypothetical protein
LATKDEHLSQASKNEKTAAAIANAHPEWAVTVYFYAALHWVEAFLVTQHKGSNLHDKRRGVMWNVPQTKEIVKDYDRLQILSRNARYDAAPMGPTEVSKARSYFLAVKSKIQSVTGWK